MRGSSSAWLRPLPALALAIVLAGCSLSLRGVANPGGGGPGTPTPFVAGGPPSVEIASPAGGATGPVGQTVYVDVRGSDDWPVGVARLELFVAGALVDRALTAGGANRLSFGALLEWTPMSPGPYQLSAYSYRADGTASTPAMLTMNISGTAITASPNITLSPPSPTPFPSTTPDASSSALPTFTPLPTPPPTPKPTQKPTPEPTAAPTDAPIAVHVDVWVEESDLPDWTQGQHSQLVIHVQNIGGESVPYVRVVATLAGSTGRARTGALVPGQETTITITLTPEVAGDQKLSVVGHLPVGYVDSDPLDNTLVWERVVTVSPAPDATPAPQP